MAAPRDGGPFVTYSTTDGGDVRVEIEPSDDGFMPVKGERPLGRLDDLFSPVFSAIESLAVEARRVNPDGVAIRFGIKVTASGKPVIAKNIGEGNFEISLNWNRDTSSQRY